MHLRTAVLTATALSLGVAAGGAFAVPFSSPDPRSFAMGGAGVAAGTSANAVFLNPALLAVKRDGDRFSIELPIVRGRVLEQNNFIDAIDDFDEFDPFQQFEDAIESGNRAAIASSGEALIANLDAISDKVLQAEIGGALVIGVPSNRLGVSLFANAQVVGGVIGTFSEGDRQAIQGVVDLANDIGAPIPDPIESFTSSIDARAALMTEIGVSLAREFDWFGGISLGITPKYVKVTTYDYSFVGDELDDVDIDLDSGERSDTGLNIDVGAAKDFGNGLIVGASIKNLIPQDYETVQGNKFKLEPMARVGLAYKPPTLQWITLAVDLDLTENEPAGLDSKTQFLGFGVEFDAFRTAQLRLGYRHNLSSLPSDLDSGMYTAGFGFSPFGAHIDLAIAGNDDDIGAAMQLGFRF